MKERRLVPSQKSDGAEWEALVSVAPRLLKLLAGAVGVGSYIVKIRYASLNAHPAPLFCRQLHLIYSFIDLSCSRAA